MSGQRLTYAYLGDGVGLVRTAFGERMFVDTRDTVFTPHAILEGEWESWVTKFIRQSLPPGAVFLDVGANHGWFTLAALKCRAERVHAFEANPRLHWLLSRTLSINGVSGSVNLHQVAVLDRDGEVEFEVPVDWSGNGRTVLVAGDNDKRECARFRVPCRSIDSMAIGRVDFIKIDVEGAESNALRGAEATLRANHGIRLLVEHHHLPQAFDVMRWMTEELGFQMALLSHDARVRELNLTQLSDVADSEMIYLARG